MIKVFISYAHEDDIYRKELEKHLSMLKRNNHIDTWTDREIVAGQNWGNQISNELEEAKVILLLISADFLFSDYCFDIEMKRAIERHNDKQAVVIPIILRHCDWSDTPFSKIQVLPANAKPVKDWHDQDEAFLSIVDGIKSFLNSLENSTKEADNNSQLLSPEMKLSNIRRKVLMASGKRDFKMALFELNEFKKQHPINFEVEELEDKIYKAIRYETAVLEGRPEVIGSAPKYDIPQMKNRNINWLKIILILAGFGLLIYLLIRLVF